MIETQVSLHPRFSADTAPLVRTTADLPAVYQRGFQLFARSLYDNDLDAGVVFAQRIRDEESAPLGLYIADVSHLDGRNHLDAFVRTLDGWLAEGYPDDALQFLHGELNYTMDRNAGIYRSRVLTV